MWTIAIPIGFSPQASTTFCEITELVAPVSQIASNWTFCGCGDVELGSNAAETWVAVFKTERRPPADSVKLCGRIVVGLGEGDTGVVGLGIASTSGFAFLN